MLRLQERWAAVLCTYKSTYWSYLRAAIYFLSRHLMKRRKSGFEVGALRSIGTLKVDKKQASRWLHGSVASLALFLSFICISKERRNTCSEQMGSHSVGIRHVQIRPVSQSRPNERTRRDQPRSGINATTSKRKLFKHQHYSK